MKKLTCNDVSGQDCPYVAEGDSNEEVLNKLSDHGDQTHPGMVKKMKEEMTDEEMKKMMESKITEG